MEWIKGLNLKKSLFAMTFFHLSVAILLSAISFWACMKINAAIAPQGFEIDLHAAPITVTQDPTPSMQAERTAEILSILQIALPILFLVIALLATASLFYRWKLKEPLEILAKSASRIMDGDLDFTAQPKANDELGQLCMAFETMRQALLENNRQLWRQAEERKRLNAAFSHELRNPVTVLKGSAKMAKQCVINGNGETEALMENLTRIEGYTSRIERYIETMSYIPKLEQVQIEKFPIDLTVLAGELENAIRFVVLDSGRKLSFNSTVYQGNVLLDKSVLFQIAENLVSNALRFANQNITVELTSSGDELTMEVTDDGSGFPSELLKNGVQPFQKCNGDAEHFGMGLYICELLCQKHGGCLKIKNHHSGASVCAVLKIL